MKKTKLNELILQSIDWKRGDFVPKYGYFHGVFKDRLIFVIDINYPFMHRTLMEEGIKNKQVIFKNKKNKYSIEGTAYNMATLEELTMMLDYFENNSKLNILPINIQVSDCSNSYYNTQKQAILTPGIYEAHYIYVLLVNFINLKQ